MIVEKNPQLNLKHFYSQFFFQILYGLEISKYFVKYNFNIIVCVFWAMATLNNILMHTPMLIS